MDFKKVYVLCFFAMENGHRAILLRCTNSRHLVYNLGWFIERQKKPKLCSIDNLRIAKIGIGLKVSYPPGIRKINLILAFFRWSHSKLDLKSHVVFIDVSLVTTTNIIRIRAYDKELRLKLRSINMNCRIFLKFQIRKLIITSQQ